MASTKAKFGFIKGSSIIDVAELPNPVTKSAINPTGTYEKFYFNTSLSVAETINILEMLSYTQISAQEFVYPIYGASDESLLFLIQKLALSETLIAYVIEYRYEGRQSFIFSSIADPNGGIVEGWQTFANPISFDTTTGTSSYNDINVGLQNELLKDLVYVEEVDTSKINTKALYRLPDGTLWHYYNGQWNAVGSNKESGTAIKPTGTYDKIYLNTNLTNDEVLQIIEKLDFVPISENSNAVNYAYAPYILNDYSDNIVIVKMILKDPSTGELLLNSPTYYIGQIGSDMSFTKFYWGNDGTYYDGWQDFENPLSFASVGGTTDFDGLSVGQQNELLKDLISATPFSGGSSNGIIEVDTLPTENINTKAIYKTPEKFIDSYIHDINTSGLLSDAYNVGGAEVVETKPTSDIVESTMSALHLYYVTSENDIFLYMNIGAGATWYSASQILSANGLTGLTFKGVLLEGETPNENGYYAYYSPKKLYKYNNNKFNEIDGVNATINNLFNGGRITEKLEINYPNELRDGDFDYINVDYLKLILSNTTSFENEKYINVKTSFFTAKFKTLYLTHIDRDVYLNFYNTASFGFCNNLKSLVLDFGVFKPISGSVFSNSTIAEGTGFVYVPDDKVNEVKALSGWSNYASQIKPLSEYKED